MDIHGKIDEQFAPIKEVFAQNFTDYADVGASFAVSLEGEIVCDIWGGHLDEERTRPWQEDTIVNVFSSTKTMSFLCALILADRGMLDFYEPVTTYWPQFGQNGKENVEVRHLMSHSAGLSGMDKDFSGVALYDWDAVCAALAEQAPWWEPGTASGYHAFTQGHLIGEVVRRISGKSIGTFFADEIAGPLGADFHIGTKETHWPRIGNLIPPVANPADQAMDADPDSIAARTFRNPKPQAEDSWTAGWRLAEIPAANGHGNARSIVRAQTPLANGGSAFGVDLLSAAGVARIFDEQSHGEDLVLGVPIRFGMGYGLSSQDLPMGPNENIAWWGGWGGSTVVVDTDAHMCVSYVMNKMGEGTLGDPRGFNLQAAAYECLLR